MFKYRFAPAIPLGFDPIICEYDKDHLHDPDNHTLDNVYAECFSGKKWCPLCGREQAATATGNDPCAACSAVNGTVAWIQRECLAIHREYEHLLAYEQRRPGQLDNFTYPRRQWMKALILRQQCKAAFIRMADVLRLEFPIGPPSFFRNVYELEFRTRNWNHCAFVFETVYGSLVFDPTGPQFGPSWPVVCMLREYRTRVDSLISFQPLGTHERKWETAFPSLVHGTNS
ncbi:hypothetical protein PMIN02_003199 [Paraphaeosphaeria minitans]|uniref:Uncharacterized protein n=1 Tax=Paraphaeosphaeria minitans TaxID=565426 RepID=A0A9P6KMI3_9PLEO|nr:hypothetical protein PMIN01_09436 [Paraphaeosphaeria minitans]